MGFVVDLVIVVCCDRLLHYGIRYQASLTALAHNGQDVFLALKDINRELIQSIEVSPFVSCVHTFRPRLTTSISECLVVVCIDLPLTNNSV
jgi:hypothetical protein